MHGGGGVPGGDMTGGGRRGCGGAYVVAAGGCMSGGGGVPGGDCGRGGSAGRDFAVVNMFCPGGGCGCGGGATTVAVADCVATARSNQISNGGAPSSSRSCAFLAICCRVM